MDVHDPECHAATTRGAGGLWGAFSRTHDGQYHYAFSRSSPTNETGLLHATDYSAKPRTPPLRKGLEVFTFLRDDLYQLQQWLEQPEAGTEKSTIERRDFSICTGMADTRIFRFRVCRLAGYRQEIE